MFFEGTLQQGIVKAVQEQKRVVCFVHSDSSESSEWKSNYLQPLNEIMHDHAVVLSLQEGSTEAGYLSAICPIDSAPMVVVIHNGQVKGTLKPPMAVDDFRKQILTAMDLNFRMSNASGQAQASDSSAPAQPTPAPTGAYSSADATTSPALNDAMAERRRRMADREAAETRQKQEAAEARQRAAQVPNSQEAYQAKLAAEKKKQRQAANEERQRVLDLIEGDKKERKKQAEQRAAERIAQRAGVEVQQEDEIMPETHIEPVRSRSGGAGGKCRLQLRLWNGTTQRAEFLGVQTLGHVKEWMEKNIEPQAGPYTVREVIGVGAARQFGVTDEAETLLSLGLTPSATLIVKPVLNAVFTSDGQERSNGMMRFIIFPWMYLKELLVALWTMLLAFAQADQPNVRRLATTSGERAQDPPTGAKASGVQASRGDFATLEDREKKKDKPTLYNGNQLGVLPKEDDEDEAQ